MAMLDDARIEEIVRKVVERLGAGASAAPARPGLAVPEPGTFVLAWVAGIGVSLVAWRKRRWRLALAPMPRFSVLSMRCWCGHSPLPARINW